MNRILLLTVCVAGGCANKNENLRQRRLNEGQAAGERGELDSAERSYNAVLKQNPRDGLALFNLGSVFVDRANREMVRGNEDRAQELAQQALHHLGAASQGDPSGPKLGLLFAGRILVQLERHEEESARDHRRSWQRQAPRPEDHG